MSDGQITFNNLLAILLIGIGFAALFVYGWSN